MRGEDVSFTDVTIAQVGNGASKCEWRHAPEARGGFGESLKSQLVELRPASREDGWLSLARGGLGQLSHEMGGRGRWKSQNRKNVYLSPYVEEPLNSKFRTWTEKLYVFFEFRDSYVLSLWTFDVRFTHSHIIAMVHLSHHAQSKAHVLGYYRLAEWLSGSVKITSCGQCPAHRKTWLIFLIFFFLLFSCFLQPPRPRWFQLSTLLFCSQVFIMNHAPSPKMTLWRKSCSLWRSTDMQHSFWILFSSLGINFAAYRFLQWYSFKELFFMSTLLWSIKNFNRDRHLH